MRRLSCALAVSVLASAALRAQTAAPAFEVASVKPNPAGPGAPMVARPQNDRITIVNVPGRQLVQMAFRVDAEQIEGAPSWLNNEHFDVTAKAAAPFSPPNPWQEMLRTLLEARFQLRARREPKEVAGMALVLGRPVVDETGLGGAFDWDLTFTPQNFVGKSTVRARFPWIDPDGPGLGAALEEQLGLKLQPRRLSRDTIVIEHVERPTPD